MNDISEKFVVLTITKHETRVWATGIERGTIPEKIFAPPELNSHHFRADPKHHGRGNGKASSMLHFIQYLERKAPPLAEKVVDAIDTNRIAMTEPEILAMAREWFDAHPR